MPGPRAATRQWTDQGLHGRDRVARRGNLTCLSFDR
jgi:hypothetical protein